MASEIYLTSSTSFVKVSPLSSSKGAVRVVLTQLHLTAPDFYFLGGIVVGEDYVRLHRKLIDWQFFKNGTVLKFWIYLLLKVTHKNCYDGFGNKLVPGQLSTGIPEMAKGSRLTPSQVRTSIKHLIFSRQISRLNTNRCSIITITNWHEYQSDDRPVSSQIAGRSQAETFNYEDNLNSNISNINNINNIIIKNKEKKEKKKNKKKNFIPTLEKLYQDWYPRKEGKTKGLKVLGIQITSLESLKRFERAVKNYAAAYKNEDKKYIKLFSTFCNKDVWVDWVDVVQKPKEKPPVKLVRCRT